MLNIIAHPNMRSYTIPTDNSSSLERIDFCEFREIFPNVIETTFAERVKVDLKKISMAIGVVQKRYNGPFAIMCNRVNCFSLTHKAMIFLAELEELYAYAILEHRKMPNKDSFVQTIYQTNAKTFNCREAAIMWLKRQSGKSQLHKQQIQ